MKVLIFFLALLLWDCSCFPSVNKRVWYTEKLRLTTQDPLEIEQMGLRDLKRQLQDDVYEKENEGGEFKIKFAQYLIKDTLIKLLGLMHHPASKLDRNVKKS